MLFMLLQWNVFLRKQLNKINNIVRDDNQLFRWNVANNEASKITEYPNELLPTDLQWIPRGPTFGKLADVILLTGADGRFHIVNRNGRIERSVEGHKGAVLVGRWSHDGAGLLTGKFSDLINFLQLNFSDFN